MSNSDRPGLGVGVLGVEPIGGRDRAIGYYKRSSFDIDSNNLPVISIFDLSAYLRFINLIAASRKFLFNYSEAVGLSSAYPYFNLILILTWVFGLAIMKSVHAALLATLQINLRRIVGWILLQTAVKEPRRLAEVLLVVEQ